MTYGSESECAIHYPTAPHAAIYTDIILVKLIYAIVYPDELTFEFNPTQGCHCQNEEEQITRKESITSHRKKFKQLQKMSG